VNNTFQLEIVTPTEIFSEGQVSYVRADSLEGQVGIMARHTDAIVALGIGEIKVVKDDKEYFYATSGGYADIQAEGVLLLLETAEKVSNIDINRAETAKKRALDRLSNNKMDQVRLHTSIARAENRIKVSRR
jgi:F-type H+-transporting ATPase subunit epsilon|tara:strand:- start:91 stop:486 length:396 start_codon:yes stop_codon:yes gene_type:complete